MIMTFNDFLKTNPAFYSRVQFDPLLTSLFNGRPMEEVITLFYGDHNVNRTLEEMIREFNKVNNAMVNKSLILNKIHTSLNDILDKEDIFITSTTKGNNKGSNWENQRPITYPSGSIDDKTKANVINSNENITTNSNYEINKIILSSDLLNKYPNLGQMVIDSYGYIFEVVF